MNFIENSETCAAGDVEEALHENKFNRIYVVFIRRW